MLGTNCTYTYVMMTLFARECVLGIQMLARIVLWCTRSVRKWSTSRETQIDTCERGGVLVILRLRIVFFFIFYLQCFGDVVGDGLFGAENRVTPQFVLQLAPLVPVDPAEHFRIVFRRTAVRDAMRPVLGQAVLTCGRLQSGRTNFDAHRDVWLVVLRVVSPKCSQWLFNATVTCCMKQITKYNQSNYRLDYKT